MAIVSPRRDHDDWRSIESCVKMHKNFNDHISCDVGQLGVSDREERLQQPAKF